MAIGERFPLVLTAAAEGADWAWAELYRDLAPSLLRFLTSQGAADPEDCLGESFIQVVRHMSTFEGGETEFRTWVFRIARNRLIDTWRRDKRRPSRSDEEVEIAADRVQQHSDPEPHSLQRAAVEEILAVLTPDQRAVLLLRYLHNFSIEETAAIVDKTEGAVRVLQHRAVKTLRRNLPAPSAEAWLATSDVTV